MQVTIQNFTTSAVQRVKLDNKSFLKTPAVLLRDGVYCGSAGCLLYRPSFLQECAPKWNGIAVTLGHPKDEWGRPASVDTMPEELILGYVSDCTYDDGRLHANLLLEESKMLRHPEALQKLQGGQLEVSTGFTSSNDERRGGTAFGRSYVAAVGTIDPDHLSLLVQERGACSWEDGCGAGRWNSAFEEPLVVPGMVLNQIDDAPLLLPGQTCWAVDNSPLLLPGMQQ